MKSRRRLTKAEIDDLPINVEYVDPKNGTSVFAADRNAAQILAEWGLKPKVDEVE